MTQKYQTITAERMSAIRRTRLERKISQNSLASRVGITREYYCKVENGSQMPAAEIFLQIEKALHELISETESKAA